MKVLLVNSLYSDFVKGGAERSVKYLAEELVNIGIEVVVLALTNKKSFQRVENGVKVYYLKNRNVYWCFDEKEKNKTSSKLLRVLWHLMEIYNPFYTAEINSLIRREKPEIVHTNNIMGFSASIWTIIKNNKLPIIHTLRDYYLLCPKVNMIKRGCCCLTQCNSCNSLSKIKKNGSVHVDSVVGISEFILQEHNKYMYFEGAKKDVILNYVKPPKELRERSDRKNKKIKFGYLGSLSEHKGVGLILDSFRNIEKESCELLIAGVGDEKFVELLKSRSNINNTSFMGFVNSHDFISEIDFLIIPSRWNEPFGRVIIEAYNHGVPVIGSRRGGIPELIDDKVTGFLFDSMNELESIVLGIVKGEIERINKENIRKKLLDAQSHNIAIDYLKIYNSHLDVLAVK